MNGQLRARRMRARLSERDLALLESLREFRLLSGQQLRRLHFPDGEHTTQARKTRATIKRLADRKLIVRLRRRVGGIRAGSEGYIVGLSGFGQAVLDDGSPLLRRRRGVEDTKLGHQEHVLAVAELAVELRKRERAGRCQVDDLRAEPAAWRQFAGMGGQTITLKPDLFVQLGIGEYTVAAFIELDLATESLPTIARKLQRYADYWRSGQEQRETGLFPRVWFAVPDDARLKAIARVIQRQPAEVGQLFTVVRTEEVADQLIQLPTAGGEA